MSADTLTFTATLRIWAGGGHGRIRYVLVEGEVAETIAAHELIRRLELGKRQGFGAVKVMASLGDSRWATSVFPQKTGGWYLPVKQAVCRAERLATGDAVEISLELL